MRSNLSYADPNFWLDYCLRILFRHVAVLHDNPLYQCTNLVRKARL
jgi:hypothetical protein